MKFEFRPLREEDLPLLQEWLDRPHVREVWGPEGIQSYRAWAVSGWYSDDPGPGVWGIDQFLADGDRRAGEIVTPDGRALLMRLMR